MIRVQGLGSPAEDNKLAARARASLLRGCRRASSNTARGTPDFRRFVMTMLVWFFSLPTRGRGQAESPAFRAPLFQGLECEFGMRLGIPAYPRRPKNRDGGAWARPPQFGQAFVNKAVQAGTDRSTEF